MDDDSSANPEQVDATGNEESVLVIPAKGPLGRAKALILVVDDNAVNRDMIARRLARQDYALAICSGGKLALDWLQSHQPDLILLDISMPVVDGFEVLSTLRVTYSARQLPIIMLTAKAMNEDVVRASRLGANDYVTKPIDFAALLERVELHIAQKRAAQGAGRPDENADQ